MQNDKHVFLNENLVTEIREKFAYVSKDPVSKKKRIFFDNAGGSIRLIDAINQFCEIDSIPDHPLRNNEAAKFLSKVEEEGFENLRILFNAKEGSIASFYTASQAMFSLTRVIAENISGENIVTTELEHPSSYDSAKLYANKLGKEFRVAKANPETGGVDVSEILKLVDTETKFLSVVYASNITGAVLDIEKVVREARKIKPDLFIIVDAVQHAPHGVIDIKKTPVDVMNFAPYKFFGVRGSGYAYVSERVTTLPNHHRLFGKESSDLQLGSPTPEHLASITSVINYVCWLGEKFLSSNDKRELFIEGMSIIQEQEKNLMKLALQGNEDVLGIRDIPGVQMHFDHNDFSKKDFILGIEFEGINFEKAVQEYEKRNITVYNRVDTNFYSRRILHSFELSGIIRVTPMHYNTKEEIKDFLVATKEIAEKVN